MHRAVSFCDSWATCRISFEEGYHQSSDFAECRYFMKFKWSYFSAAWCYSHRVGHAGNPTRTVYVDVTLTWSKVKVKVTGLLNFRQFAKPCMLAAMTAAPLRVFLVIIFDAQNPEEIWRMWLWISPPHLKNVTTLTCKMLNSLTCSENRLGHCQGERSMD